MKKVLRRSSEKRGLAPGTPVYVSDDEPPPSVRITVFDYDAERFEERDVAGVEDCVPYRDTKTITWINVDGVHDPGVIEAFGRAFDLHPLLLEDLMHTEQRPKVEVFENYVYIVVRMLYDPDERDAELEVDSEQISIVVGPQWVLTFQERSGDIFDPIRERIRTGRGRVRKSGADYLAYVLIDVVVDHYFSVLERFGDRLEELERRAVEEPDRDVLAEIRDVKRALIEVRRAIWPLRDLLAVLLRGDAKLFKKPTLVFLRDAYDHTIRVTDMVETYRELSSGLMDVYLSNVSHRMNEVMKFLTIIATIFIPLTFIAGVYGMNFERMPELTWRFGYLFAWAIMVAVGGALVLYFRRKRWF